MRPYDAVVIGAGPAGSLAAHRLADAGASVLLIDASRFPRDKPCGGGLTARAVRELPFSPAPVVEQEVVRLVVRLRDTLRLERASAAPLALMTQRLRLDAFLVERAVAAGAQLLDGLRARAVDSGEGRVELAGRRPVRGTVVIGADGANGICARALGHRREFGVAIEGRLPYERAAEALDRRAALIDLGDIGGGYGWLFPKADHLNVGVGGAPREGPRLRAHLARLCAAHGVRPDQLDGVRGYRLPIRVPGSVPARDRMLLVGDAAGLIDPVSGDGMYEAFVSARLAAEAALRMLAGRPSATSYAAALEHELGDLHALSWHVKLALERFPRLMLALASSAAGWRDLEAIVGGARPDAALSRGVGAAIRALAAVARLTGDPADPWRLAPRYATARGCGRAARQADHEA